jgi:hypothetical protein
MSHDKPLVLAYYFAQYHSIPQNDQIFGDGFTDWELFKHTHLDLSNCKTPLEMPHGLGYYNPIERDIRIRQAALAKKYGIDGFVYYHYWLENEPVMESIFNVLLNDNEPDMPFCICFANESWKHCYGSKTKEYKSNHSDGTTFRQLYGDPVRHAAFLEPLFKHNNYIKINNAPVFFIYRLTADVYHYMDQISNELRKVGIDRLYLIANTSIYCLSKYDKTPLIRSPDAHSPFLAHMLKQVGPWHMPDYVASLPCLYSGLTGWDCNPRHGVSVIVDHSPETLAKNTYCDLMKMYHDTSSIPIYVLFAWNEWGEGAVLEPNTKYGEELGYGIYKGKKIYQSVISILTDIKFEYGIENQYTDITKDVFIKCINFLDGNDWEISIPITDVNRDTLFGDHLPGIHKVIRISHKGEIKIYDEEHLIHYIYSELYNSFEIKEHI